jgi:hypothetical protein
VLAHVRDIAVDRFGRRVVDHALSGDHDFRHAACLPRQAGEEFRGLLSAPARKLAGVVPSFFAGSSRCRERLPVCRCLAGWGRAGAGQVPAGCGP